MGLVLEDLEVMADGSRIPRATYHRLREMIRRSPHVARDN
jgi:hypothetical protein